MDYRTLEQVAACADWSRVKSLAQGIEPVESSDTA
jgi:hypothetical protein